SLKRPRAKKTPRVLMRVSTTVCVVAVLCLTLGASASLPAPGNVVTSVGAGWYGACAVTAAGGVKCWGANQYGQVGNGTTSIQESIPVDVVGFTTGAASVAAGYTNACAVTTAGGVKCWGYGNEGGLGNGGFTNSSTPVNVTGLSSGVLSVAIGSGHTCVLLSS